jgi:hypothetical protein
MSQWHEFKIYILEMIQNEILVLKSSQILVFYKGKKKLQFLNCY